MKRIAEAELSDGSKLQYVEKDNPPRGGMKYTYFTPDKTKVIQFFNDPEDANSHEMRERISAILGKYNPTLPEAKGGAIGNTEKTASYFLDKFCWPTAVVVKPEFGIVCPAYPAKFFFSETSSPVLELKGKDKKSNWFTTRNRRYLANSELGDFRSMLQMSISLARSIRRLHQAGLAHSDLSNNNVLIDPQTGSCVVIDIDSLVVPGLFPPEVAGTRGYIAPEVLETMEYAYGDPRRITPSIYTDTHALAVLIYEYLFLRHPLVGPKIYSRESAEKDDFLAFGPMATFIENPNDTSNRPPNLNFTIKDTGPILEKLFLRAFVDGLHDPNKRPTAMEWEKGLVRTWDLLHQCKNPSCGANWFVLSDKTWPICPYCGRKVNDTEIVRLNQKCEVRGRSGQWMSVGEIDVYDGMPLFKWHIFSNVFPDEKADRTLQAYVCKHNGQWLFVNQNIRGMHSPSGNIVPPGQAVMLKDGTVFRASDGDRGVLIEVSINKV